MNKTVVYAAVVFTANLTALTVAYKLGKRDGRKETFNYIANDLKNLVTEHLKDKSPAN